MLISGVDGQQWEAMGSDGELVEVEVVDERKIKVLIGWR
jgi:hypothetical protein